MTKIDPLLTSTIKIVVRNDDVRDDRNANVVEQDVTTTTTTRRGRGSAMIVMKHHQECNNATSRSSTSKADELVIIKDEDVNDMDVLAGRGGKTNTHRGNRIFHRLVDENKTIYQKDSTSKQNHRKYFLALSIVVAIENLGGRFLKKKKLMRSSVSDISSSDSSDSDCSDNDNNSVVSVVVDNNTEWIVMSRREAIAITCQALRREQQQQQLSTSLAATKEMMTQKRSARKVTVSC